MPQSCGTFLPQLVLFGLCSASFVSLLPADAKGFLAKAKRMGA